MTSDVGHRRGPLRYLLFFPLLLRTTTTTTTFPEGARGGRKEDRKKGPPPPSSAKERERWKRERQNAKKELNSPRHPFPRGISSSLSSPLSLSILFNVHSSSSSSSPHYPHTPFEASSFQELLFFVRGKEAGMEWKKISQFTMRHQASRKNCTINLWNGPRRKKEEKKWEIPSTCQSRNSSLPCPATPTLAGVAFKFFSSPLSSFF